MAARQGFSAQISQASEDAKQKLLSHAHPSLKSSWFSNLNTTCTIKSAPPRTPEVLSLLSLKSGWLWKRNEQHVWQPRWCCVVPHTFLYYFDSSVGISGSGTNQRPPPPPLTAKQQSMLNEAVKRGYGNRPHSGPRTTFNVFQSATSATASAAQINATNASTNGGTGPDGPNRNGTMGDVPSSANNAASILEKTPPAGIIDLECYTTVHRSSENSLLLELAGDDAVNPDLRSFYFYCDGGEVDSVDWTQALLQHRFSSLQDELEAFREVSEGFASQLQELHVDLDFYKSQLEETQDELYGVRSTTEDARRTSFRLVRDVLDDTDTGNDTDKTAAEAAPTAAATISSLPNNTTTNTTTTTTTTDASLSSSSCNATKKLREARQAYRRDLEATRDLGGSVVPAVQLLCDYVKVLEETCVSTTKEKDILERRLQNVSTTDATRVKELQSLVEKQQDEWSTEKMTLQQQIATLKQALVQSQKLADDAAQEVTSTRLEMTMYQNSTKQRLGELLSHKKILKREVIDLRQKLDEVGSELSLLKHTEQTTLQTVQQERQKSELLEKYVERMESQVKVQQSMMEMMSISGNGNGPASVHHFPTGSGASVQNSFSQPRGHHSEAPGFVHMTIPSSSQHQQQHGTIGGHHEQSAATSPRTNLGGDGGNSSYCQSEIQREHNELLRRAREMVMMETEADDEVAANININNVGNNNNTTNNIVQVATMTPEDDEEEKSHMSELTEDRTQKHFYAQFGGGNGGSEHGQHENSPLLLGGASSSRRRVTPKRLPSYIGVQDDDDGRRRQQQGGGGGSVIRNIAETRRSDVYQNNNNDNVDDDDGSIATPIQKLDTIMSSASSVPLQRVGSSGTRRISSSSSIKSMQHDGGSSVHSTSKLSVAQRARLEADQRSNSNSVRVAKPVVPPPKQPRTNSESSLMANIGKSLTDVIDHTVLGLPSSSESDELSSDEDRDRQYGDIAHSDTGVSEVSAASTSMSLQERQSMQRAKQLAFLKEQGLIKEESHLRGGAGASPNRMLPSR